jgi:hypothetical protein
MAREIRVPASKKAKFRREKALKENTQVVSLEL